MKRLLLAVAAFVAAQGLYAQDCTATSPPYSLDFETVTAPALPGCTTVVSTSGNNWTTAATPGSGFASKALQYNAAPQAANAWFFTRALQLEAGQRYKITYTYGNNSAASVEKFTVAYGTSATAAGMTNTLSTYANVTGATPVTASVGPILIAETGTYYFGFNANSDASQGNLYIDDISVVPWVCDSPAAINVTNITAISATLSWNAVTTGEAVQFYQVAVTEDGAPAPMGGPTTLGLTYNTMPVYAFKPSTTYTAYLRTFCSGAWGDWVTQDFTTAACSGVATVPYIQDFESATTPDLPACNYATAGATGGNWATVSAPGSGFTTKALTYAATGAQADAWYFTQAFELVAGNSYKISYTYGNNGTTSENLSVKLFNEMMVPAANLAEHNAITGGTPVEFAFGSPITINITGVFYLAFHATSDASQGSLFIDNIKVEEWPCSEPTAITLSNVVPTAATVNWVAPADSNVMGYFYAYNTTGDTPADFQMNPGTTLNLTQLQPATTYYLFIRSFCGPVFGDWTEPVIFTTPVCAEVATIPYIQDFETAVVPAVPDCNLATAGQTGANWVTATAPGNGFTTKALTYTATNEAADAWYFTQGFELEEGVYYKISYTYGNNGAANEDLDVYLASGPNQIWATNPIAQHNGITGGTAVAYVNGAPIGVGENGTGVYYLAFHITSEASQGSLFIDNIKVEEWSCAEPTAITVGSVTTSGATVTWTAPEGSVVMGYFYAYNTTGETPTDFDMNPGATLTLTDLDPDTTYYLFVKSFCGPIIGEWAEPVTFTTALAGVHDVAFGGLSVYPNPSNSSITINNTVQIDSAALYNVAGQLVLQAGINNTSGQLQLQHLAAGVYMLKLQAGEATKTIKVIKQ